MRHSSVFIARSFERSKTFLMASFPVHDTFLDELSCPVCFEDFTEPKCLPGCAHNVCKSCLEAIVRSQPRSKRGYIECPICRDEALIPNGGISKIPTNTLIVRMLERASIPRAQQEIMKALKRSKEKMEALRKFQTSGQSVSTLDEAQAKGKVIKRRIEEKARELQKLIKSQEEMMIAKVNNYIKNFEQRDPVNEVNCLLKKLDLSVKQAEDVLSEPNSSKILQSKEAILKKLEVSYHFEINPSKGARGFDLEFFVNEDLEQRLQKEWFGKVAKEAELDLATKCQGKVKVLKTITVDDIGETSFSPYTIAVSVDKGEMAVLDDESNRVHILRESAGNYQRSFGVKFGDLYDVAFVQDKYLDGVIVVNRSHNRLLAYQRPNGKFYPMFYATYQSIHTEVSTVNFSSASATSDGRLIVTSEALDESCVLVVDIQSGHAQQKRNLVFGKGHLACPRKALYYENEFFVCDRDNESIKVFDARGAYRREIGEDLECPRGIAIDNNSGNILIADPGTDSIHAYKSRDGSFVGKIALDQTPVSIGINSQGNAVVCYHDSSPPCLQILSFEF